MNVRPLAAVVGVGTELITGIRTDTNTAEIATALLEAGYRVTETVRLADDVTLISAALRRLTASCSLVVVTGGLGPTHDDITREGAAHALGLSLERDAGTEERLASMGLRHQDTDARKQLLKQADVLIGATVIAPTIGTAPGQIVSTATGTLVILPGPPHEMRPMLATFLTKTRRTAPPARLRCAGTTESDAQVRVQRVLVRHPGIGLTVLASPAEVEIVLFADGAGARGVARAATAVREILGDDCYSDDGSSLAETVVRLARMHGVRLSLAESCTGGMIAAAITDVTGSSDVFVGGIVAYSNAIKMTGLNVTKTTLAAYGAVSPETAAEMAMGAMRGSGADLALSVTGVAGPGGGSPDKPVGTVWFGLSHSGECRTWRRDLFGDRTAVRLRATVHALDAIRRELQKD